MTEEEEEKGLVGRLVGWFDSRLGLSYPLLKPVPQYSINPFYWLGALTVVAFLIQGVTGMIMMLYYIPTPTQAYSTTLLIFKSVYFGQFLETIHLYTAYAMIMLAFMHMMRGYFVSVHKKPREAMWVVGMLMGFVTLGFGFTGYLLPWTVLSKSGTDVGIGMIQALPQPVSSAVTFLAVGSGGDAGQLLRFFDLHIVILPVVLIMLLLVKMYMLEAHGVSEPVTEKGMSKLSKLLPIFPDVTVYLLELAALFGAGMLIISVMFPIRLAPEYTPQLAGTISAQPDWYFLWIYQILKIKVFEGNNLPIALTLVTLVLGAFVVLPFIDRGGKRGILERPVYVTLGAIFVAEVAVLAGWGLVTPGAIIGVGQAILVLGGTAALVGLSALGSLRLLSRRARPNSSGASVATLRTAQFRVGLAMIAALALGALGIGVALDSVVGMALGGVGLIELSRLVLSLLVLATATFFSIYLAYRMNLGANPIRRKVAILEAGWGKNED
jgi:quinol-cytochrome oxidoreductase complex cytochrome b subunit